MRGRWNSFSSMMMNLSKIRQDFPILQTKVGKNQNINLIYLDNAASSQKPQSVIEAITRYYSESNANVHRGIHTLGERATSLYEEARNKVRRFINAPNTHEIIFTRGTTESINLVASSLCQTFQENDEIIFTEMEHHSNIVPWFIAAQTHRLKLKVWHVEDDGQLDLEKLKSLLSPRTKLLCVTWMSNVLGTINPIKEIIRLAHDHGTLVLVDGAQGVPHLATDVVDMDVDFLAFSSHKMCGPMGIGVLYGKEHLLESMPPYQGGGEMIKHVRLDGFEPNTLPYKFEAGTPNVEGAIGLSAAIDYISQIGMQTIHQHDSELVNKTLQGLEELPEVRILGPKTNRGGLVAFSINNIHAHDVAAYLDRYGVAVRAGHHCAHPLAQRFGIVSSVRASYYFYNSTDEVEELLRLVKKAICEL